VQDDTELEYTKGCQDLSGQDPQESAVAIYSQFAAPTKSASTMSKLDGAGMPEQVVEVANDKQE
jgi:hypothetical protein